MDLERITNEVEALSLEVGRFIMNEWDQLSTENIEAKGLNDFVTYVDTTSEKQLVKGLKEIVPEAGFLVDPLDGTTNYIHGIQPFSISVALEKDQKIVLGLVIEPGINDIFKAWQDGPAFLNGSEIHVSKTPSLDQSLISTGFPYKDFERVESYLKLLRHFM